MSFKLIQWTVSVNSQHHDDVLSKVHLLNKIPDARLPKGKELRLK